MAKVSWAIRPFSREIGTDNWNLFMETHFRTRKDMRKAYKAQPFFNKDGSFFRCTRHRVTTWEAAGKLAYTPTR
ncbi:UNVERIFIED_CONTAM: hypothetical protein RF648_21595 [Kocuria sp. CPCC 205274]